MALLVLAPILGAQNGPNQPQPPVQNDLLDQLVGFWAITGTTRGEPVHEGADAEWVLGHQFLRIHRKQIDGPLESIVNVGFDTILQRFVAFRLDTNGAHGAEYPGYGLQKGDNKFEFNIQYPSGPWRETWTWDAKERTWQFLVEIQRKNGKDATWSTFSSLTLHGIRGGRGGPGRGFGPQPPHPQAPPQAAPVP